MDDNENEIEKTEEEEPQDIKPDITKLLRVELIEKIEQNLEWDCEEAEQQPKRQKLSNSQYLYEVLFKQKLGSDIKVVILEKEWNVHKVIIQKSPYFAKLFENDMTITDTITVNIPDPNINHESVEEVLASLYKDEINMETKNVISILATATFFELQEYVNLCFEFIKETININTVISYYKASVFYNIPVVKAETMKWLEINLIDFILRYPPFLKDISIELMTDLILSTHLMTMQTEFSVYMFLRKWLFVQLRKTEDEKVDDFYKSQTWTSEFLLTDEGSKFSPPFKAMKLKYLLRHPDSMRILESDRIVPRIWILEATGDLWKQTLLIHANRDQGPSGLSSSDFERESFRCGIKLKKIAGQRHTWWWDTFMFGLDLEFFITDTTFGVKRAHRTQKEHIELTQKKYNIMLQASLISLNKQRQISHIQTSELLEFSLEKNREQNVLNVDKNLTYPLFVVVKLLVHTPPAPKIEIVSLDED